MTGIHNNFVIPTGTGATATAERRNLLFLSIGSPRIKNPVSQPGIPLTSIPKNETIFSTQQLFDNRIATR
jgi:hypothetical protein